MKKSKKEIKRIAERRDWRLFKFVYAPLIIAVVLLVLLHFQVEDFFLKRLGVCTKAVIGEGIDYHRGAPPTYEYTFAVNGSVYSGDSGISDQIHIGDTVPVVYLPLYPGINRSIDEWFKGGFICRELAAE